MRHIYSSVDIGSNTIKIVVGEIRKDKLNIIAVSDTPSKGVKNGIIINEDEFIISLKESFKRINELVGVQVDSVIVNVPSNNAEFMVVEGSSTITSEDKKVSGIDVVRALQASVYNKIMDTKELISLQPVEYYINNEKVDNPKGIIADKITVKAVAVTTPKKYAFKVLNAFERVGLKVIDVALNSMGDYAEFKNDETDKETGIVVNIGEDTTTLSVINKGILTNTLVLEVGSTNIDNDISFIFKVNKIDARFLKEKLALSHKRLAMPNEVEELTNKLNEKISINQYEVTEIVVSRITEILDLVKKEINHLTKKEISYIIFTGGLTESRDFQLILEETFGHKAYIGSIGEIGVRNNKYSSCVGMIKYFNKKLELRDKEFSIFDKNELEDLVNTSKRVNISSNSILGKIFGYFFDN